MYTVIVSEKDRAGMNIFQNLQESDNFELIKIKEDSLYADDVETKGDIIIFATRHSSEQQKPCLCVHTPGNWSTAELGGQDSKLCISPATLQTESYLKLKENNTLDFEVTNEATHHGPLMDKPCMFIEIGSTQLQWENRQAGQIIAKTIMNLANKKLIKKKPIFGIGGPHYCNNFNKLIERSDYALGHVCPKYMLDKLTPELIRQAMDKTYEESPEVVLDWKGLGKYKQHVIEMIEELGLNYKKIKELM